MPGYEATLTRETSLFDHLMWQLQVSDFTEQEQRVATALIGNVNDDGYLKGLDLHALAEECGSEAAVIAPA